MNAEQFKSQVLQTFFRDIQVIERDNYCVERFSYDGVDRSGLLDVEKHASLLDWFVNEYANVFDVYHELADEESRKLYLDVLRFKLAGHLHVRIDTPVRKLLDEKVKFAKAFPPKKSTLRTSGMFGELRHYDGVWNDRHYTVDTIVDGLTHTLINRQYYFERDGVVIQPGTGDHLIDAGACTGETSIVFSRSVGPTGRVYAFDPVQAHLDICEANFSRPTYENIQIFPYGLSDRRVDAPPVALENYSPGFRVDEGLIPLARIDDLVISGKIEQVDFIKMDIEGSEMAALRGACASIHEFRPKLAISIYHTPNDYFEVCRYLRELDLGYKFYLGHYTIFDEETVLYAIC